MVLLNEKAARNHVIIVTFQSIEELKDKEYEEEKVETVNNLFQNNLLCE